MDSLTIHEGGRRTEAKAETIPRPEYPRPQFVRPEWANLNGPWEFRIDDANEGLHERWFAEGEFPDRILVPFSLETDLSGVRSRAFHFCVWYKREFIIPAGWTGRRVLLHFGAVDYRAIVWVNEIVVGNHEGGHTPFHCDITGALREGPNTVIVRAEDPPDDRYIPRGKQYWEVEPVSIFYARTTGIWQTVWMEPVAASHLQGVRITSHTEGSVRFEVRLAAPSPSQSVRVRIFDSDEEIAEGVSLTSGPRALLDLQIAKPKLWSPDDPHLYSVRLDLEDADGVLDSVDSYFGIRSVRIEDGRVFLNDRPVYLKTVLDQGYWSQSNLTPPSDEAIRDDILRTKELGFNGARKHQKVEDPRYLYWADKLGLLVSAEMANAYLFNEEAVGRMTREWIEVVNRDYNHPSIIIWVPVNESWGVPNLKEPRQQAHLKALYYMTKSLDDTRLVIDNDGWEHTEATDLFAIHDYTETGEELYPRFKNVSEAGIPQPRYGKLYLAPGYQYNRSPIFLSEFGGIGYVLPADREKVPEDAWGYSGIEPDAESALKRIRGLYEAVARIPEIAGICYTQLYDVEQEVNGLMTYDRRLKFDAGRIREINDLLG